MVWRGLGRLALAIVVASMACRRSDDDVPASGRGVLGGGDLDGCDSFPPMVFEAAAPAKNPEDVRQGAAKSDARNEIGRREKCAAAVAAHLSPLVDEMCACEGSACAERVRARVLSTLQAEIAAQDRWKKFVDAQRHPRATELKKLIGRLKACLRSADPNARPLRAE